MDRIARSCKVILDELKHGRFTKDELILLDTLFSKIVKSTKKLLLKENNHKTNNSI